MIGYELPSSVSVGGTEFPIRTDYRVVLDVFAAMNDADVPAYARGELIGIMMFPDWDKIPIGKKCEAVERVIEWIDQGNHDDGKPHPRLIDWEQDANLIVPAVNAVAHTEIRALPYLHWWTFLAYYMDISGESLLSTVLTIRQKRAEHKKLEKWEQEFYRKNKDRVDLRTRETAEIKAEKEQIEKYL